MADGVAGTRGARREARLVERRNCALREAQGDYLIFVDDDETPDPEWLRAFEG
jgi:glycosyltransferase involved in cell wall biosynthesis